MIVDNAKRTKWKPVRMKKQESPRVPSGCRRLRVEPLEDRRVLSATVGFTGDYVLENWAKQLIAGGTTSITPASGAADEATFGYEMTLQTGGLNREQTVDFLATAAATGTVTFDYQFTGDSKFFQALAKFATISRGAATPVVDDESTFGDFSFSGSASFIAQQGENLGFRIGGGNSDSNRDIDGELTVTNIVFHDELLAPIVVDTNTDIDDGDLSPGNLSLREAVRLANEASGVDTITFDASLAGATITLTEGELPITSSLTINGLGADQLTISGGGQSRVFAEVGNGQRIITITDVKIANGLAPSATGGGAFFTNGGDVTFNRVVMTNNNSQGNNGSTIVAAFGTLVITDSAIVNNLNTGVGAIRLQDNTTVIANTTISGNGTRGISLFNSNSNPDSLSLNNVTIANNANEGIEIVAFASTTLFEYQNTIFANNGGQGSIDARGNEAGLPGLSILSLGHNILDDTPVGDAVHAAATGDQRNTDPLLESLADNGGPTPTHALQENSPAIDAGDPAFIGPPVFDQRGVGFGRLQGGRIDIGAFEVQVPSADFDGDGDFDGRDFLAWQRGFGLTSGALRSDGDADGDGDVDGSDLEAWQLSYGDTPSALAGPLTSDDESESPAAALSARDADLIDAAILMSMDEDENGESPTVSVRVRVIEPVIPMLTTLEPQVPTAAIEQSPFAVGESNDAVTEPRWLATELLERVFD